jgi:hypothetical protein
MTFPCKAATVWSDDFNDGNYNEWTVMNGTFIVEDGMLKTGPGDYNLIVHPSYGPTTGTWSFDISGIGTGIVFIGTYPISYGIAPVPQTGFTITSASTGTYFILRKWLNGTSISSTPPTFGASASLWQHINVTRNSDGRICIYDNGTLVIDYVDNSVISTSDYFSFWSARPAIIDNIVVSDTVDIQPPAAPFYTQTWFYASVGVVAVVAVAIVVLLMRRK